MAVPQPKLGEQNFPELSVLPAVDEDVDAGVEHQHQKVTSKTQSVYGKITIIFLAGSSALASKQTETKM